MRRALLSNKRGFTLFEILIALFVFSVVISTIFAAYSGTFRIVQETEATAVIYDQARIALERICEDLESIYIPREVTLREGEKAEQQGLLFLGKAAERGDREFDVLTFLSYAHINFEERTTVFQPAEIVYYVKQDTQEAPAVLYRSDTPLSQEKPAMGTGGFPLCEGITAIDFTYYDADGEAHETWGAMEMGTRQRVPSRVDVLLTFDGGPNGSAPIVFKTGVAVSGVREGGRSS